MPKKKALSKIKSNVFERSLSVSKWTLSTGVQLFGAKIKSKVLGVESDSDEILKKQFHNLANQLGELKGSLMKIGQMVSILGEHLLPAEAVRMLQNLQSDSPPLEWKKIEKILVKNLGPEKIDLLEIDPEPIGAASLGQVHRAKLKKTGEWIALKIQYPGVDSAIESDLKIFKTLIQSMKWLPGDLSGFDEIFDEVRQMMHREVDYTRELEKTKNAAERLSHDSRYIVPKVYEEFSTKRVLATELLHGVSPKDWEEKLPLTEEQRKTLSMNFLELYFREVFQWQEVQTDPQFGNYLIQIKEGEPKLVLLDFGAVRKFPKSFMNPYLDFIRALFSENHAKAVQTASQIGLLFDSDSDSLKSDFIELCQLFLEPFAKDPKNSNGVLYHWEKSELPKRVLQRAKEIAFSFRFRPPPREIVFLDRKMAGVFLFCSAMKIQLRSRGLLEKFIKGEF